MHRLSRFPRLLTSNEFANHYNYFNSQIILRPVENVFRSCVTDIMEQIPLPISDEHKCEKLLRTILHVLPKYKEDFYKSEKSETEKWVNVENEGIKYLKNSPYGTHFIHRATFNKIFYRKNMEPPEKKLYETFTRKLDFNSTYRGFDINNCGKVLGVLLPQLVNYRNEKLLNKNLKYKK